MKSSDQIAREKIPTRADVPTQYDPLKDYMMVVPLPDISAVGDIILPEGHRIVMNEGHIVAKGPLCSEQVQVGDCVTWDKHSEFRMEIDNVKFVLVREASLLMRIPNATLIAADDKSQGVLPLGMVMPAIVANNVPAETAAKVRGNYYDESDRADSDPAIREK